jgi:hypothetical protein
MKKGRNGALGQDLLYRITLECWRGLISGHFLKFFFNYYLIIIIIIYIQFFNHRYSQMIAVIQPHDS